MTNNISLADFQIVKGNESQKLYTVTYTDPATGKQYTNEFISEATINVVMENPNKTNLGLLKKFTKKL